jgi:hypothetical protein
MRDLPELEGAKWVDSRDAQCETCRSQVHSYFLRISIQKQSLGTRLTRQCAGGDTRKGQWMEYGILAKGREQNAKRPPEGGRHKDKLRFVEGASPFGNAPPPMRKSDSTALLFRPGIPHSRNSGCERGGCLSFYSTSDLPSCDFPSCYRFFACFPPGLKCTTRTELCVHLLGVSVTCRRSWSFVWVKCRPRPLCYREQIRWPRH